MDADTLALIVADYLLNRDDIASATATDAQVYVVTQGGTAYTVTVL